MSAEHDMSARIIELRSTSLVFHCIYGPNQVEHPGRFVVRRWDCNGDEPIPDRIPERLARSLAEARGVIPDGCFRMPRDLSDDPSLIESWLEP
jgi:hypothetical protein